MPYDIDNPASLVAEGWKAFDLTDGDYSVWRNNLFGENGWYPNRTPTMACQPYDCTFEYRVSGNLACYIMGNEEFISWVQNNIEGECPPIVTPMIGSDGAVGGGATTNIGTDDDEESVDSSGGNPFSPFTAFLGLTLFGLPLWALILISAFIYTKVKKKR